MCFSAHSYELTGLAWMAFQGHMYCVDATVKGDLGERILQLFITTGPFSTVYYACCNK